MPGPHTERRDRLIIAGWVALALLCATTIALRLNMTVDLAFFLPDANTSQEKVLIDRLGQGPGSRLIFITLPGEGRAALRDSSNRLRDELQASGLFTRVLNGQEEFSIASIPREVWTHRYLLTDTDWSSAGLRSALQDRLADLGVLSGEDITTLIGADPYLASARTMEGLSGPQGAAAGDWIDADGGAAYLIAETAAPVFDVAAQTAAVNAIRAGASAVSLNGVGAYSVQLEGTIKREAQYRSLIATVAIMLVLFAAYRRFSRVLLASTPLLLGALAGLAAVALLFGQVHGITLAFGFTLFGVAVDYPLHLFSHADDQPARRAIHAVWHTMRLGAVSTIIAYFALIAAGSQGLAQLGCLSAVGVATALYATRTLLPVIVPSGHAAITPPPRDDTPPSRPALRHLPWLAASTAGALILALQPNIWTNDLASLTPLPADTLAQDNRLRRALGAPDIRFLLLLQAATEEDALVQTEQLQSQLAQAQAAGIVDATLAVTALLPSRQTQERRALALRQAADIDALVGAATTGLPFRRDAFGAFVADARATLNLEPLTSAAMRDPLLQSFVANHLYFDGAVWNSSVTLYGLNDPQKLADWLADTAPQAQLIDLKSASESLVHNYRLRVAAVLAAALGAIALLLLWRVGISARLLWISGTLSAAVLSTIAAGVLLTGQLSIFNLIALVLVAGLGFDYALFMSRTELCGSDARRTRHALRVCAGSTLVAFTVLGFSSVPILASIGSTVAIGVALNYALAWIGSSRSASD